MCARLPEVTSEVDGHDHMAFRVHGKTFVSVGEGFGAGSLFLKAEPVNQAVLIERGPYVAAPYIGHHGWVVVSGDARIDWGHVADLIEDAYRMVAPKALIQQLDGEEGSPQHATHD